MSMEVNGAAILMTIAQKPSELSFSESQLNSLGLTVLLAKLKEKDLGVEHLRKIAEAIGKNDFKLVLDHLPAKDTTSLIKRLDTKNPELKTADEAWSRSRAAALILEGADPRAPEPKAAKAPPRSTGSKTGKALQSKALKPRAPKKSVAKKDA